MKRILNMEDVHFRNQLKDFLEPKAWFESSCHSCQSLFYSKTPSATNCNSFDCLQDYKFIELGERSKPFFIDEVADFAEQFFLKSNFTVPRPMNVINEYSDTLFKTAVIQNFMESINYEVFSFNSKFYSAQASIRLRARNIKAGIANSFVNIATTAYVTLEDHFFILDLWLALFSQLGIYISNVTLIPQYKPKNLTEKTLWSKSEINIIKIVYQGLEIGDAGFVSFPLSKKITISDIGIGLERLT